ncbi:bifunctional [glutamate--ammonia ligase]-adenylyl-L-tyrosine phosphorylase/[glutamate--ammonia-ligase] adenylyltransferase [Lysobacter sp. TY2-98]|uniref:bifunctional [glutamate--ammonia ligase]-adenylyl-L-tyrosine phosphorylase/[glutamate--ammonia-ligase] adenylyltransferase n=1 Tax=Lysobacter sp. TY2-98 TaxID=2290922 RepID=UPI000E2002EC|nr:bifunctional [glutamate--ammonia ligase]-adenylyl-L-tyrosine phosphorylase/[glutamate--ammonia-ligase] adenylyltransferase [Lysobacter sp. TY2-98]AXK73666.1 bifunctional [glutamate--ammonia ligase]-adenylyl-L-tyrosine phosphorylase/[glutamate--ammonia-ligase] adenylyltransferase [Lysobacter sp. TY2-98]
MSETIAAAQAIDAAVDRALRRLDIAADDRERVAAVARASDFAIDVLARDRALLAQLLADDGARPVPEPLLDPTTSADWPAQLRRYRTAASTRLIWRDVLGLDDVDTTLAGSTQLAERCLALALDALETQFAQRHGVVRDGEGRAQRLVVFGLGKLGGGELNFSSDIDLVYAYETGGESDGARPLDAEGYFTRLGQQLAKLLDDVTADGFSHRVDLRLRPFGTAGRLAWSFAALEQYFQREGRDWERYAWQKARPVAGDIVAGERFLETLRPFVYRRYLDFGALDGLRTMKASIAAEVARRELVDDIKRGPGGIREVEFLVQALQLIRGGREPALRDRRLLPSLRALVDAGHVDAETGDALTAAYRTLRRVENRLQMLRDAQTHALPDDAESRERIATGLGYRDWNEFRDALDAVRARVTTEFNALLAPRERTAAPDALAAYWSALPNAGEAATLADAGFAAAGEADALLRDFSRSPAVQALSDATRARLDRVMPALLHGAAQSREPLLAMRRLVALVANVLRRSAYLALLDEQPAALERMVDVVAHNALLAERLAMYPLLLDELLDARVAGALPDRADLHAACNDAVAAIDDTEHALRALNEVRQALSFRIAMAVRDRRQPADDSARQLAWLADAVVDVVVRIAQAEVRATNGELPGARFAVLGYGSLGGEELGFGSDLDLVFLYDAPADAESDGARPLDAQRWFARLAQKVVALLGAATGAGRLFDVDVRLRPDGAKGLLVSSLASFSAYQRERAWTWEHQALVRARCIGGDASLCADYERVRAEVLGRPRDTAAVMADVTQMRLRMRAELDRSDAASFDLKQGEGGLVDLEFVLQALVLAHGARVPALLHPRNTHALIEACRDVGVLDRAIAGPLAEAHALMLARGLDCTLDRRARRVPFDAAIEAARAIVRETARAVSLDFGE